MTQATCKTEGADGTGIDSMLAKSIVFDAYDSDEGGRRRWSIIEGTK